MFSRNYRSAPAHDFRVTTLLFLRALRTVVKEMRDVACVRDSESLRMDDEDDGKMRINNILGIICINIFIHQRIHTYRRVSFQRTLRGSAMVTSGGRRGWDGAGL
jgi:hypothetical protein